jgi:hypothetical protein
MSISRFNRAMAMAADGLAPRRSHLAHARDPSLFPIWLGANCWRQRIPVPQLRSISCTRASNSSASRLRRHSALDGADHAGTKFADSPPEESGFELRLVPFVNARSLGERDGNNESSRTMQPDPALDADRIRVARSRRRAPLLKSVGASERLSARICVGTRAVGGH